MRTRELRDKSPRHICGAKSNAAEVWGHAGGVTEFRHSRIAFRGACVAIPQKRLGGARDMSIKVVWAFDLISPFAYLSLKQLPGLPAGMQVELMPVLFAGLLK